MLHILWVVIKFILIVLGVLLGLVLLAALLFLFCPVRYKASASKEETDWKLVTADAGVSWLFGGVSLKVWLTEGEVHNRIRVLGIPLDKLLDIRKKHREKKAARTSYSKKDSNTHAGEAEPAQRAVLPERKAPPGITQQEEKKSADIHGQSENGKDNRAKAEEKLEEKTALRRKVREPSFAKKKSGELFPRILEKLKQIVTAPVRLIKKLAGIPGMVIKKIRNIALTFRHIYDRMDWWKQFVSHPRTQEAISLIWKHAKGLIKHVLPTKIQGNITFGSEDPAVMGTVLALLGMSIPLHKNCIAVTPVFDRVDILKGDVRLKGRIYGWMLLKAAVTIYFNKNVKYVISRWKHKEG